jgi:hypothetical protein
VAAPVLVRTLDSKPKGNYQIEKQKGANADNGAYTASRCLELLPQAHCTKLERSLALRHPSVEIMTFAQRHLSSPLPVTSLRLHNHAHAKKERRAILRRALPLQIVFRFYLENQVN